METLTLKRQPSTAEGVFGQLFLNGNQIAVTAELPWNDNEQDKSCVPALTYLCIPHNTPSHPNTWELTGVPNRSEILIHAGNFPLQDSLGCIIIGNTYGVIDGVKCVLNSLETLEKLRIELPDNFYLTITNGD